MYGMITDEDSGKAMPVWQCVGETLIRRYLLAATFLSIAACSTSGPESPVPVAKAEMPVTTSSPTAAGGVIEDVDVPEVPKIARVVDQTDTPRKSDVVCRREKTTGSHRVTQVCRRRADIDATREADQRTVKKLSDGIRK